MERLPATEGEAADPVAEWSSLGGDTGLEEPMWQIGIGGGGGGEGGDDGAYPERPDEANCSYYLRTGFCGYGARCRFNHPPDRNSVVGAMRASGGEYPERLGQPVCQYYMRTGMCKFGASCKYHHPRQGGGSASSVALNVSGYPVRLGEKECSYYLKTGQCKFGMTCKFHHPQAAAMQVPAPGHLPAAAAVPSAFYQNVQSPVQSTQQYGVVAGNWPVVRPTLVPGSYIPGPYGSVILPPGMVPVPGWNPYQPSMSPVASPSGQSTVGAGQIYGLTHSPPSAAGYPGPYASVPSPAGPSGLTQNEQAFPERPGQPDCQYFLKTGDCKFGSSCRYHHPPQLSVPKTNFVLSALGLPLRPGAPLCSHYSQKGVCKFGPSCKFDHPMAALSYSPSASSLSDMPVAPYPVGASMGTLAPSSSSSNLRPELLSASGNFSTIMPTSLSTAAGSVGSTFSRNIPLPHSIIQQPGQSVAASTDGSSKGPGEVHTSS